MNEMIISGSAIKTMSSRQLADVGYVYVVESTDGKSVKIGKSKNPEIRVKTIKRQSNSDGRTWISSRQYDSSLLENKCHKANKDARMAGEWFAVKFDSAVACVESLCGPVAPCVKNELKADKDARGIRVFDAIQAYFKGGTNNAPPKTFSQFLGQLPAQSPVHAAHKSFVDAEAAISIEASNKTAQLFAEAGTVLRETLEEQGHSTNQLVSAYIGSLLSSIELVNAISMRIEA